MKKIIILFLALCLSFCGCVSTEPQIDPNLVEVTVTGSSNKNISIEITNNSKDNLVYGEEYAIEFLDGENWVPLEERTEAFFIMIAHVIEPGKTAKVAVDFEWRYGALSNGTYRIVKEVRFENKDGEDFGGQQITAEFEVVAIER